MALEGTLSDFSLPDIFQLISLQRKSGILTLKSSRDVIYIYFTEGNILAADSEQDPIESRLGYYLVRGRFITEENLKRALDIQKETLQRLGNILLSHNILNSDDLQKTLQLVIMQKIYRVFRWRDGEYHFDAEVPVEFKDDYFTPIPAQGVLMEAVRMTDEWPMLEKEVPNLGLIFKKTGKHREQDVIQGKEVSADDLFEDDGDFSNLFGKPDEKGDKINDEEKRILRFVDGKRSVKDIMLDAQVTDFDASHSLVALLHANYIELLEQFRVDKHADWVKSAKTEKLGLPMGKILTPIMGILIVLSMIMMSAISINIFTPIIQSENMIFQLRNSELTKNEIGQISSAIHKFYYSRMKYPVNLGELVNQGFISDCMLKDSWGNRYNYVLTDSYYMIICSTNLDDGQEPIQLKVRIYL